MNKRKKNAKKPSQAKVAVGLISRSEAASLKGVLPSSVSMACRAGGPLHPAVRSRFLDSEHASFTEWMSSGRGDTELRDLAVRKRSAEVVRLELANAHKQGEVISRDLVRAHVFGHIDSTNRRLLGDVPRTMAQRISALVRSGEPTELVEAEIRDIISSVLRDLKAHAVRVLRGEPEPPGAA